MKKLVIYILVAAALLGAACATKPETADMPVSTPQKAAPQNDSKNKVYEITEKMFIAQINDVYLNADDYMGKVIKYEGMFNIEYYADTPSEYYYSVIRYGPGCCGTDKNAGFEVIWPETPSPQYPNQDDWVEVVGILEQYEEYGNWFLRLSLTSLIVLDTRGEETVLQ